MAILKEAEAGASARDICRKHGISHNTFYKWKSRYAGLEASDLKRIKELEAENARLKQLYAELSLENASLKDLLQRKR